MYTMEYYAARKKSEHYMDGPRHCPTKGSRSDKDKCQKNRQITRITYTWNLKNKTDEYI